MADVRDSGGRDDGSAAAAAAAVRTTATTPTRCGRVGAVLRTLSRLSTRMSLRDQKAMYNFAQRLIVGTALLTYPVAYAMGNIFVVVGSVLAAYVVAVCVCCPNWLQRDDEGVQWVDRSVVAEYYKQYEAAKAAQQASNSNDNSSDEDSKSAATRWATRVLRFVHLL